jgi:hypothetical protein
MVAEQVKEKPILFMASMVNAILQGKKTQTRRPVNFKKLVKGVNVRRGRLFYSTAFNSWAIEGSEDADLVLVKCPYGEVGGKLWVRETWGVGTRPDPNAGWVEGIEYRADEEYLETDSQILPLRVIDVMDLPEGVELDSYSSGKWRPSIFMPRWASRLTLEVLDVSIQRLQDISEEDAIAEGFEQYENDIPGGMEFFTATTAFEQAWKSKYGAESWEANPWVWVVKFKKLA